MVQQIIPASAMALQEVEAKFGLQQVIDDPFFSTGFDDVPELTHEEKQRLDRVKAQYFYLAGQPTLKMPVNAIVVSTLFDLAGFYDPPFYFTAKEEIELPPDEVDGESLSRKLDLWVLQEQLWIAIAPDRGVDAEATIALPHTLTSMMECNPKANPSFGFLTNGKEFLFVRLARQETPRYALSQSLSLASPGNEFYTVLRELKAIGQQLMREGRE